MSEKLLISVIDNWVEQVIRDGEGLPDFWDDLNTTERLASALFPLFADLLRDAERLKKFPLPSQGLTSNENYSRILAWLYEGKPSAADIICDAEIGREKESGDGTT